MGYRIKKRKASGLLPDPQKSFGKHHQLACPDAFVPCTGGPGAIGTCETFVLRLTHNIKPALPSDWPHANKPKPRPPVRSGGPGARFARARRGV